MKVSVIVPVFNGEKTLERSLNSILNQIFPVHQIIIILNNCSDQSEAIAMDFLLRNPEVLISYQNISGAGAARNKGLDLVTGDLIAFCDCDDEWLEDKIQLQIDKMRQTGSDFCCSYYNVLKDEKLNRTQYLRKSVSLTNLLRKRIVVGCSTVLIKTSAIGELRFVNLKMRQDFIFFCEVIRKIETLGGSACMVNVVTTHYHVQNNSLSRNKIHASYYQFLAYRTLGYTRAKSLSFFLFYVFFALIDRLTVFKN